MEGVRGHAELRAPRLDRCSQRSAMIASISPGGNGQFGKIMAELTPEERERIYLEEKTRLEARSELEGRKTSVGKVVLIVVLCGLGLLIILAIIGDDMTKADDAAFNKLSPEQRHQKTLESCVSIIKSMEFKTYEDL